MLIDSHCHLDFDVFHSSSTAFFDELNAAKDAGLSALVVPAVSVDNFEKVRQLPLQASALELQHGALPKVYCALGLHPYFLAQHQIDHVAVLEAAIKQAQSANEPLVAVGEIGLDFFLPELDQTQQIELFEAQLAIAKQFDLPVILHVRKAHDQVLKRLRQVKLPRGGVVHAYSGSEQQAAQYIALGFKLGFGGAITYPRATKLRGILARLPNEGWVLETDAPDMPLCGNAGEPNRPAYVADVAEQVAEIRQVSVSEVIKVSGENAMQVFGLSELS